MTLYHFRSQVFRRALANHTLFERKKTPFKAVNIDAPSLIVTAALSPTAYLFLTVLSIFSCSLPALISSSFKLLYRQQPLMEPLRYCGIIEFRAAPIRRRQRCVAGSIFHSCGHRRAQQAHGSSPPLD